MRGNRSVALRWPRAASNSRATRAMKNPPPLVGAELFLGTFALSLATFMIVLDTSIANVSLSAIAGNLGVSPHQGTWVITSFAVANAITVPLTGWLTQRIGQVKLFTGSVILFVLMSLLCGLAPSIGWLIFFRIVQGLVAGPMMPLSQALLLSSYRPEKQGSALSLAAITTLVAPVLGPLLGGWITDNFSWPWIFYINIPVGVFAASLVWRVYHRRESDTSRSPIDVVGLALLVLSIGAIQIVLDRGKDLDWFESPQILVLALVGVVGLAYFIIWEVTDKHPVVDLSLFRRLRFSTATATLAMGAAIYSGTIILLPLWLQGYMGYTATLAGAALAPIGFLAILMTPLVGKYVHRFDARMLASIGFALFAVSMYMRSGFTLQSDRAMVIIPTIVQGAAVAFFFVPISTLVYSGLRPQEIASASGLFVFARTIATAVGTSVFATLWDRRQSVHVANLAEQVGGNVPLIHQGLGLAQSAGLSDGQAYGILNRMVASEAATSAMNDVFYLCALLFLLMIPLVWLGGRQVPRVAAGAPADTGH
jgi:DHA2 family multidrug resistance protein